MLLCFVNMGVWVRKYGNEFLLWCQNYQIVILLLHFILAMPTHTMCLFGILKCINELLKYFKVIIVLRDYNEINYAQYLNNVIIMFI